MAHGNNTAFCNICRATGKSQAEYTSHYVRDKPGPKGVVCCPTLLAVECGYCHQYGHTPTHCPQVKMAEARKKENVQHEKRRRWLPAEAEAMKTSAKPKAKPKVAFDLKNGFGMLSRDSDSASDDEPDDAPPHLAPLGGWVSAASKPAATVSLPHAQQAATPSKYIEEDEDEYEDDNWYGITDKRSWEEMMEEDE